MSPVDVLFALRKLDVKVWVEAGKLCLSAPRESFEPELRSAIDEQETALIGFLAQAAAAVAAPDDKGIQPVSREGQLALSFAQQRFWFLSQLGTDNAAYNLIYVLLLIGDVDVDALNWSLGEIVRRHEALRTTFTVVAGDPVQQIEEPRPVDLIAEDLSGHDDPGLEVHRRATEDVAQPFDPEVGPPYRFSLLRLGEQRHCLLLTTFHIVSDGWSYGVLFDELSKLYGARTQGQASPLPALAVQYPDYAAWQRQWYEDHADDLVTYWKTHLQGLATLELPTDRPRPAAQTFRGKRRFFSLPENLEQGMRSLGAQEGATYFMTMLAVFKLLLARYSGQRDIVVGTPVANRELAETEPLIGLFLNTLVLRSDLSGALSFRELVRRVKEVSLGAFAHQQMPFEQLVVELRPERDMSRNPLFQVLFNILVETEEPEFGGGVKVEMVEPEVRSSMFDLSLILAKGVGTLEYNADLFDEATMERFEQHLLAVLRAVVADPDRSVWDISLPTEAERQLVIVQPNQTSFEYPRQSSLVQLFEAQVERTPDAVAAISGAQQLSYTELNRRANQLACHLRNLGAGPDKLIGISVERGLDMLVGLFGILKAGAAYVPLDPAYPNDRLAFIVEDAGIELLVTQETLRDQLPGELPPLVCLDSDSATISALPSDNLANGAGPNNLAYVIFTSGSTGRPKGVQIEHRALVNFLSTMAETPGLCARRRVGRGDDDLVRYCGSGVVPAAVGWCARRHRWRPGVRWTGVGGASGQQWGDRHAGDSRHLESAVRVEVGRQSETDSTLWWRGITARAGRAAVVQVSGTVEHVRTHRDHDLVVGLAGCIRRGTGSDRAADRQYPNLRAGPEPSASACWRSGRALPRWRWASAWILEAARSDRRAIRPPSATR